MNIITKEAVLTVSDLKHEDVPVPEWGGTVRVRELTARERDAFESTLRPATGSAAPDTANLRARLCVRSIVGEDGSRLFNDEDADALGSKSAQVVDRIFTVAQRLSGIGADQGRAAEKNSGAAPSGASSSA